MGSTTALVYGPAYDEYRFGDKHPFDPLRLRLTVELIEACGLLDAVHYMVPPRYATIEELETVHSAAFIKALDDAGDGRLAPEDAQRFGLGTEDVPIFPRMLRAARLIAGGSLRAAELVMGGAVDHAFNIGGGLHHAGRSTAAGFCIVNDVAIVCERLARRYGARVLYIDNDAHHGDGVQDLFYDRSDVLTLSFHETGRYLFPGGGAVHERGRGPGYGYAVNVPLDAFTDDASWLSGFEELVPEIARRFHPDVIVLQAGCDGHAWDPLTHLHATTRTFERVTEVVHGLAHELCDGRLIVLGGGGYDIWRVTPRVWTLVWAILGDQVAPAGVPLQWRERWQERSPVSLPRYLRDDPAGFPAIPRQVEVSESNSSTYRNVRERSLPLLRSATIVPRYRP